MTQIWLFSNIFLNSVLPLDLQQNYSLKRDNIGKDVFSTLCFARSISLSGAKSHVYFKLISPGFFGPHKRMDLARIFIRKMVFQSLPLGRARSRKRRQSESNLCVHIQKTDFKKSCNDRRVGKCAKTDWNPEELKWNSVVVLAARSHLSLDSQSYNFQDRLIGTSKGFTLRICLRRDRWNIK